MGRARGRARRRSQAITKARAGTGAGLAVHAAAAGAQTQSLDSAVQALTGQVVQSGGVIAPTRNYPRDPLDNSAFGPLFPLLPQAIDPARPDTGQPEPRVWEYPNGFNLPGSGDRLIDWGILRQASTDVDVIRRCIEIRKEDLSQLTGAWVVSEKAVKAAQQGDPSKPREDIESALREKFAADIARLEDFWERPWVTNGYRQRQWFNAVMESHLVFDGVAVYPVTSLTGEVIAFRLVDTPTVKLLINSEGERPQPPHPAFQQVLYGFPRGEYLADAVVDADGNEDMADTWTAAQLTYWIENVRTNTPYGYSAVEQALISAALYLKRQGWMHAEYDEGSTPMVWLEPQGDKFVANQLSPLQRREYERAINDDLSGQTGQRHRIKVGYPGYLINQMTSVDERYKPDYDLYLVKMVISHMGVTMDRYGLTEAKGLGASGQHERQAEVQDDSGVNPDARMLRDLVLDLSRNYLNAPKELDFQFSKNKAEDAAAEDAVAEAQLKRGSITWNEDRRRMGRPTYTMPEADMPMFLGASGPVFIEGSLERAQAAQDQAAMLADAKANPPAPGGGSGGSGGAGGSQPKPKPSGPPGGAVRKSAGPMHQVGATIVDDRLRIEGVNAELRGFRKWSKAAGASPARPFRFEHAEPFHLRAAGFDLDPSHMAFDGHVWLADGAIEKDWRAWNAANPLHPRGPHGRFVKLGNLVDELRRTHGPLDQFHEDAFDEAVRRAQAGRHIRRGQNAMTDELERRGLLEELGGAGQDKGRLSVSEAGRQYLDRRWGGDGGAGPDVPPEHTPAGGPLPIGPVAPAGPVFPDTMATAAAPATPAPLPPLVGVAGQRETGAQRMQRMRRAAALADAVSRVEEYAAPDFAAEPNQIHAALGSIDGPEVRELADMLEGMQDPAQMAQVARDFAHSHGLRRIGEAGSHAPFEPALHASQADRPLERGEQVYVMRPGYLMVDDNPARGQDSGLLKLRRAEVMEPMPGHTSKTPPEPTSSAVRTPEPTARERREAARLERLAGRRASRELVPLEAPTASSGQPNGIPGTVEPMTTTHPQKEVFDKLLDEGRVTHRQSRQIVEQMEAHGWRLAGQNPMLSTTQWEAPDGRTMAVQFLTEGKPKFYRDGQQRGSALTYRDALAYVVTPTHVEVRGPNLSTAAEAASPGLGERISDRLIRGGGDASLDPLVRATRQLSGYGGTQRRELPEVTADLRAQAARLDDLAESNAAHHARLGVGGDSAVAQRQREQAAQFRGIADDLERQAEARRAYEAEVERRAGLPLDIRPGRTTPEPEVIEVRRPNLRGYDREATAASARVQLDQATSREQAARWIDQQKLTAPQLRQLAADLEIPVRSSDRKDVVRDTIVSLTAGRRLDSRAIFPGDTPIFPNSTIEEYGERSAPTPADAARERAAARGAAQARAGQAAAGVGTKPPGKRAQSRAERIAAQERAMAERGETGRGAPVAEIREGKNVTTPDVADLKRRMRMAERESTRAGAPLAERMAARERMQALEAQLRELVYPDAAPDRASRPEREIDRDIRTVSGSHSPAAPQVLQSLREERQATQGAEHGAQSAEEKLLDRATVDALSEERDRLSRMNSLDRRAKNPPEEAIKERTRRLGQIRRQLKAHYDARDRLQAQGHQVSYADDTPEALVPKPSFAEGQPVTPPAVQAEAPDRPGWFLPDALWEAREAKRPRGPIAADPDNIRPGEVFPTGPLTWAIVTRGKGTTRMTSNAIQVIEGPNKREYSLDLAREAIRRHGQERAARTEASEVPTAKPSFADQQRELRDELARQKRAQIEADTREYDRLYAQAEELDVQINFAESDEERADLVSQRNRLDDLMAATDQRIAQARKELARERR